MLKFLRFLVTVNKLFDEQIAAQTNKEVPKASHTSFKRFDAVLMTPLSRLTWAVRYIHGPLK
jgi:hypothetical protein